MLRELCRDGGERLEVVERRAAPLEVARAQARRDELLEQRRLAPRGGAEGAQVPGVEPVAREAAAGGRDVDVALAVDALAGLDPRRDEVVLLEPPCEVGRDPGALAELAEVDLAARVAQRRRPALRRRSVPWASSSSRITRSGRNSSRCRRRIVSSRSTSSSEKSR